MAREKRVVVKHSPGLECTSPVVNGVQEGGQISHHELKFEGRGNVFDIDEEESKQKLAIMLSAIERKSRPWCPICNIRRVARNSKNSQSPLDAMCGICAEKSLQDPKGTRRDLSSWT